MKRSVLFIAALVFAFCTFVMAQGPVVPKNAPAEKAAPAIVNGPDFPTAHSKKAAAKKAAAEKKTAAKKAAAEKKAADKKAAEPAQVPAAK